MEREKHARAVSQLTHTHTLTKEVVSFKVKLSAHSIVQY